MRAQQMAADGAKANLGVFLRESRDGAHEQLLVELLHILVEVVEDPRVRMLWGSGDYGAMDVGRGLKRVRCFVVVVRDVVSCVSSVVSASNVELV